MAEVVPSSEEIARTCRSVLREDGRVVGAYLFGSRVAGDANAGSDVDVGVLFGEAVDLGEKIRLEALLESALGISVDLVDVGHCDAFVALDVIRGERIYEADGAACDEFDLYVLRRAGDLAPFERERRRLLFEWARERTGTTP